MSKISLLFFSENNGICELQRQIIKEVESIFKVMIDFKEIDIQENQELKKENNIKTTPTIIVKCKGKEKERFVGLTQELFLRKAIRKITEECR